jgi:ERF superfamily
MSEIFAALSAVMGEVSSVSKDERNTGQGFNFRGIDAVVNAVGPALRKHGVIVVPRVQSCDYATIEIGEKRKATAHVRVIVEYIFIAQDGSTISCTTAGEAMDGGDKATAKAMSVAFRIALLQALALPTSEPDPDASSYERSPAKTLTMKDQDQASKIHADILAKEDVGSLKTIWDALKANDILESSWAEGSPTFAALIGERVAEMKAAAK